MEDFLRTLLMFLNSTLKTLCFESVFYYSNTTLPFVYGYLGSGMVDLQKEIKLGVVSDLTWYYVQC